MAYSLKNNCPLNSNCSSRDAICQGMVRVRSHRLDCISLLRLFQIFETHGKRLYGN